MKALITLITFTLPLNIVEWLVCVYMTLVNHFIMTKMDNFRFNYPDN